MPIRPRLCPLAGSSTSCSLEPSCHEPVNRRACHVPLSKSFERVVVLILAPVWIHSSIDSLTATCRAGYEWASGAAIGIFSQPEVARHLAIHILKVFTNWTVIQNGLDAQGQARQPTWAVAWRVL